VTALDTLTDTQARALALLSGLGAHTPRQLSDALRVDRDVLSRELRSFETGNIDTSFIIRWHSGDPSVWRWRITGIGRMLLAAEARRRHHVYLEARSSEATTEQALSLQPGAPDVASAP
jgi:DNA-binding MarR family transcriptional regulator